MKLKDPPKKKKKGQKVYSDAEYLDILKSVESGGKGPMRTVNSGYNYPTISAEGRSKKEVKEATKWAKDITETDLPLLAKLLPVLDDPMKIIKGMSKTDKLSYNRIKMNKNLSPAKKTGKLLKLSGKYLPGAVINVALGAITTPSGIITGSSYKKGLSMLNNTLNPIANIKSNFLNKLDTRIDDVLRGGRLDYNSVALGTKWGKKYLDKKVLERVKSLKNKAHTTYKESLEKFTLTGDDKDLIADILRLDKGTYSEALAKSKFVKDNHGYAMYLNREKLFAKKSAEELDALMDNKEVFGNFEKEYFNSVRSVTVPNIRNIEKVAERQLRIGNSGTSGRGTYTGNSSKIRETFATPSDENFIGYTGDLKLNLPNYNKAISPREKLGIIRDNIVYGNKKGLKRWRSGDALVLEQPYGGAAERIIRTSKQSVDDTYPTQFTQKEVSEYLDLTNVREYKQKVDYAINSKKGQYGLQDADYLDNTFYLDSELMQKSNINLRANLADAIERQKNAGLVNSANSERLSRINRGIANNKEIKKTGHANFEKRKRNSRLSDAQDKLVYAKRLYKSERDNLKRDVKSFVRSTAVFSSIGVPIGLGLNYSILDYRENKRVGKAIKSLRPEARLKYEKDLEEANKKFKYTDTWIARKRHRSARAEVTKRYSSSFAEGGETDKPKPLGQRFYESIVTDKESKDWRAFEKFSDITRETESFGVDNKVSETGYTGPLQYNQASVDTAVQRLKNITKVKGFDKNLTKEILAQVEGIKVGDMSYKQQRLLMLGDLIERPEAPFKAWLKGKATDKDLYYKGHHTTAANAISSQDKVYENWNNGMTRYNLKIGTSPTGINPEIEEFNPLESYGMKKINKLAYGGESGFDGGNYMNMFAQSGGQGFNFNTAESSSDMFSNMLGSGAGAGSYQGYTDMYSGANNMGGDMMSGMPQGTDGGGGSGMSKGMMAGILGGAGNMLSSLVPEDGNFRYADNTKSNRDTFKFDSRFNNARGKQYSEDMDKQDAVMDTIGKIPLIGGLFNAGKGIAKGVVGAFGGKDTVAGNMAETFFNPVGKVMDLLSRKTFNPKDLFVPEQYEGDRMKDYLAVTRTEFLNDKKDLLARAYQGNLAEYGGEFGKAEELPQGIDKIEAGGTHQQNPVGGITISTAEDGTPNKAEEGEVIVKVPKEFKDLVANNGTEYVFSNKLFVT